MTNHQAYISAFATEHHEMRRLVHRLLDAARDELPWSAAAAAEIVEALAALDAHLEHHFAQEERGGYLEEALALAPRFSAEAAELLREHPQLLCATRAARQRAELASRDSAAWPGLKHEIMELIRSLRDHEAGENRIVQQAFNTGQVEVE